MFPLLLERHLSALLSNPFNREYIPDAHAKLIMFTIVGSAFADHMQVWTHKACFTQKRPTLSHCMNQGINQFLYGCFLFFWGFVKHKPPQNSSIRLVR
jgi:hypothetical protein